MAEAMTFKKRVIAAVALSLVGVGAVGVLAVCAPSAARAQATEPITTANIRAEETEAGDLLADAVRVLGGADIGLVPAAAFKPGATVARPATAEQATGLVEPASDVVVVVNLRGDQILAALERSVSFAPQPFAGFLQVSGLKFSFNPQGDNRKRVSNATVGGTPLEASRTYKVAMPRPLAGGQQGYHQVWGRDQITTDTGKSLAVALQELARARGGMLSPTVEGRITQAKP